MKTYKVTMWSPLYTTVKAENKELAIEKAQEDDNWEAPFYEGEEKFDVELKDDTKKQRRQKC